MLKGISPLISPELLAVLARMGHGDEIILADAHFPGETFNGRVFRADGLRIPELLAAILPLFELDAYVPHPLAMMAAVEGDQLDPAVETSYLQAIHKTNPQAPADVYQWLEEWQMPLLCRSGVRVIHDYMRHKEDQHKKFSDLLEMELRYCQQEPFVHLGRYMHLLASKP